MSAFEGPRITLNGLVLYLDAVNSKSYNNTTTWFDVSGNNNTGTMIGTVPLETDVVKCFNFSGVTGAASSSASLGFTFASNMIPRTGDFTFSCWIKNPPSSSGQVGLFSNSGSGDGYRFGVGLNGIYYLIGPNYQEGTVNFLSSISSTTWNNVVAVYNRTTSFNISLYLNGIFQNSQAIPTTQTISQNVSPGLVRSACCGLYTGKLSLFAAHSRALSAAEISQNFNALRGRYGI